MTTFSKPSVRSAWGQTATPADLQDPGDIYASKGWQLGVKPPRQYDNWVLNYVFSGIRYFSQNGVPAWDAAETYGNLAYVLSPNGYLCRAIANTTNQNPDTPGNFGTSGPWDSPNVKSPPYPDSSSRIPNTSWVSGNFLAIGTTFASIQGLISAPQVPVGAVTQWQGSLSIGGAQVTSAVNRANNILLLGSGYATFNWSGQSSQPTWLFGSNDGTNVYVWNPANFNVANANTVAGLSVTSAAAGNTVMARDANGYAYAQYFNQASPNSENPSIGQFLVTNGTDNFGRKASVAAVQAALGVLTTANFAFSSAGWQRIANGGIVQGGRVTVSGTTNVTFPLTFPSACFAVAFTNEGSTNQIFINGAPTKVGFQATNGNSVIDWIAFGY